MPTGQEIVCHTPGPWCVEDATGEHLVDICLGYVREGEGNPFTIAFCHHDDPRDGEVRVSVAEAEANARLMAAAPDLLDELTKAHEIITAMLNAMTVEAKDRVARDLERRGISPDGMTRYHERAAALRKAVRP